MSATGRGTERREADYYPTPAWCVQRLLDAVHLPGGASWLEPSAGEGHIIRAVRAQRPEIEWYANELRPECGPSLRSIGGVSVTIGDFLTSKPRLVRCEVALGNPPFSFAQEFVLASLAAADQVVFLLRLSFLESQKRESFFGHVGVPDVFVLPERPSFTGEGTDSCAYAWMRWKADKSQEGRISILYDTRQQSLFGGQQ